MQPSFVLVSHALCPYVQRVSIVLDEKGVAFERRDIDLARKPPWFLRISPLGKTPVLLVDDSAVFESAVICEYLDETVTPRMHPENPLERARHRGWMEYGSGLLGAVAAFYGAPDEVALASRAGEIRTRLERLEEALGDGPFFDGQRFSIVDAAFAPVFRYFDTFDRIDDFSWLDGLVRTRAWRAALQARESVRMAVGDRYPALLQDFLAQRNSALSRRMNNTAR